MNDAAFQVTQGYRITRHQRRVVKRLRAVIERRQVAYLWGQRKFITPRLLGTFFGDGRQLVAFSPVNTRPNYYVVRIDSGMVLSNWDKTGRPILLDLTDSIWEELEDEFGECHCEEDGKECRCWFPIVDDGCGSEWWGLNWPKGFRNWPVAEEGGSPV